MSLRLVGSLTLQLLHSRSILAKCDYNIRYRIYVNEYIDILYNIKYKYTVCRQAKNKTKNEHTKLTPDTGISNCKTTNLVTQKSNLLAMTQ